MTDAEKALGGGNKKASISMCCAGSTNGNHPHLTAYGFIWKFKKGEI